MSEKKFLVTAIHDGFLDKYRTRGDVFEVTEAQFADRWMARGDKRGAPTVVDVAKKARQESLVSGGPTAALTVALADLKEANEREVAHLAKIAELEEKIIELQGAVQEDAPPADEASGDASPPADEAPKDGDEPAAPAQPAAPVQRVRRTPAAS